MWAKQIEVLKENYRVIAYDVRGHGKTEIGNDNFSIDLFVNDLLKLMDALKIDKTIICGFSMGGYIALKAIVSYPDRFNALILSDTSCAPDTPEAKERRMKAIEAIKANGLEKYAEESLKKLFAPISVSEHIKEVDIVKEMIMKSDKQSLYKTLHALAEREETCTRINKIKVPVLIMVGKEDEITPPEVALMMHEKIKGSIIHIADNAGHLSNMENPKEFNNQLTKFLSGI
jgi:pimeloyl-ACP methyl ester carboxylesterase